MFVAWGHLVVVAGDAVAPLSRWESLRREILMEDDESRNPDQNQGGGNFENVTNPWKC